MIDVWSYVAETQSQAGHAELSAGDWPHCGVSWARSQAAPSGSSQIQPRARTQITATVGQVYRCRVASTFASPSNPAFTSVAVRDPRFYVPSAAYETLKDPDLLLARLSR